MNPEELQKSGLPLPQSPTPAAGYSFAAPPVIEPAPSQSSAAPLQHETLAPVPPIIAAPVDTADSDDNDELDEAWTAKAREIVEKTRDDPYLQTKALASLRIDFLKTRYNRESKISEDPAK